MVPFISPFLGARRFLTRFVIPGLLAVLATGWIRAAEPAEIQSVVALKSGLQLTVVTEWERRYRVEASGDLEAWKTLQVSEPAEGDSLAVEVPMESETAGFFRVTVFEWEELHAEWQEARQRWRDRDLKTYQFEFLWNCHCPFRGWSRVEVEDGQVVRVVSVETGEPLPRDQWSTFLTVEGLFDWIESRRALLPVELRAEFDPVLGHPVSGYFDLSRQLADEELGFQLRSLSF